jgi:hypothetical protein
MVGLIIRILLLISNVLTIFGCRTFMAMRKLSFIRLFAALVLTVDLRTAGRWQRAISSASAVVFGTFSTTADAEGRAVIGGNLAGDSGERHLHRTAKLLGTGLAGLAALRRQRRRVRYAKPARIWSQPTAQSKPLEVCAQMGSI